MILVEQVISGDKWSCNGWWLKVVIVDNGYGLWCDDRRGNGGGKLGKRVVVVVVMVVRKWAVKMNND